jgi:hypothetical protein
MSADAVEQIAMNKDNRVNILPVVDAIVEIARTTHDPETARLLMELAHRLLEEAGLPSDDHRGGGELPNGWVSDLVAELA